MNFREWLEENTVLAHVSGPAGVGKTTLMRQVKQAFPQVMVIDLDAFDTYGNKKMQLPTNWKQINYSDEKLAQSHVFRQQGLNSFISKANKLGRKVVIFGIHHEGDTEYEFDTPNKFILYRTPLDIAKDRLKRDYDEIKSNPIAVKQYLDSYGAKDFSEMLPIYQQETEKTIRELQQMGYKQLPISQAFTVLAHVINGF